MHPNRKVAVASFALDFVSLSACDEDMVQECDKAARAEALKRRRAGGHETNKLHCQRNSVPRAPKSEHNSSQDISSELGQLEEYDAHFPTLKDPRRAPSCRFGESQMGGGSLRGSFGESLSSLGVSSSDDTPPAGRPLTSDSLGIPRSDGASPHAFAMPSVMGRGRSLRPVRTIAVSADVRTQSSLRSRCPSRTSLEASHRGLQSLSVSGASTPNAGIAEVYEGYDLLVRCPTPKRPKRANNAMSSGPHAGMGCNVWAHIDAKLPCASGHISPLPLCPVKARDGI